MQSLSQPFIQPNADSSYFNVVLRSSGRGPEPLVVGAVRTLKALGKSSEITHVTYKLMSLF